VPAPDAAPAPFVFFSISLKPRSECSASRKAAYSSTLNADRTDSSRAFNAAGGAEAEAEAEAGEDDDDEDEDEDDDDKDDKGDDALALG
jgi:hypothetical protein